MVQSVLGSLILGYRPLWNRARKLAGIQLYAHNEASATVDGGHLLRTLQELTNNDSSSSEEDDDGDCGYGDIDECCDKFVNGERYRSDDGYCDYGR